MGIKERKERDKLEMKDVILKAATEMFLANGYEKTSIRAIAQKIEYSVGTIYLYFKDKTELLHYIMQQGFEQMNVDFAKLDTNDDIIVYLKKLGVIYIEFAFKNPEYYDLMFIIKKPIEMIHQTMDECIEDSNWGSGHRAYYFLHELMQRCIEQKRVRFNDADTATLLVWGFLHGMISLNLRDRLKMVEGDKRAFFIKSLDDFIDGIAT